MSCPLILAAPASVAPTLAASPLWPTQHPLHTGSPLFFFYKFIYFWLRWVLHGFSLVVSSGGYSLLQCAGFSLQWLLLLRSTGSRHAGFSSCSTWAQ